MNIKKTGKILGGAAIAIGAVVALPIAGPIGAITGIGALIAGGAGGAAGGLFSFFTDDDKVKKLGIIGMKSSGKTTFLNNLRGIKTVPKTTSNESYDSFEFKLSNKKNIHIVKGNDIGGGKSYQAKYREIIKNNDVILYFFNVCEYLTNLEYKRDCNQRLDHINVDIENKKIAIIASHSDLSQHSKNILREELLNQVIDKKYSKLFNDGFFVVNLTDDREIKELIDKIFS